MHNFAKNTPLVSIIVNNFNYARFLKEAIDSAIEQTYPFVEIIVVDDGSTDNSREIIESYGDSLVTIFQENRGQAAAFNTGFAASKGDIICFLDSDDTFLPEKVAEIVKVFSYYPEVDWCFHGLKVIDKNTGEILAHSRENSSRICDFRKQVKQGKFSFFAPATSGLCFRRSLLEIVLPMAEELKPGPDRYLVNVAPVISPGFFLDKQLAHQGIHGLNINSLKEGIVFDRRRATRHIIVAYFIRLKFPNLKRFSNRIFARGISFSCNSFNLDKILQTNKFFQEYLKTLTRIEKMEVWFIVYCRIFIKLLQGKNGNSIFNKEMGLIQTVDG